MATLIRAPSTRRQFTVTLLAPLIVALSSRPVHVEAAVGTAEALLEQLRAGGHNIYFRHAATEWSQFDRLESHGDWTSCDPGRMRQLSDAGRDIARTIPVGGVFAKLIR